jgi:hypothetical protein
MKRFVVSFLLFKPFLVALAQAQINLKPVAAIKTKVKPKKGMKSSRTEGENDE